MFFPNHSHSAYTQTTSVYGLATRRRVIRLSVWSSPLDHVNVLVVDDGPFVRNLEFLKMTRLDWLRISRTKKKAGKSPSKGAL